MAWGARLWNGNFSTPSKFRAPNTISGTPPISFSAWINPTSDTAHAHSIIASDAASDGYDFPIASSTSVLQLNKSQLVGIGASSGAVTYGSWQQVGVTYDASGNFVFYIAGSSSGSGTNLQTVASKIYDVGLAAGIGTGGQTFNGSIADAAIWNVVLTAAEMSALGKGARPGTIRPKSLVSWWPIDGLQSPEPDLSGNVNNGTLTNAPTPSFGPPLAPFTPRWSQANNAIIPIVTGGFQSAWARGKNIVIEGVAT